MADISISTALRCALADLEGILPEYDPEHEHPAWETMAELRELVSSDERLEANRVRIPPIFIDDLTNEQAREWLIMNDSEAADCWRNCYPIDLKKAVRENLQQFGEEDQDGSIIVTLQAENTEHPDPDRHDSETQIMIIWSVEDVLEVRPDLSRDQGMQVLRMVEKNHDASVGVNWDTLEGCAQVLFGDPPSEIQ